MQISQFTCFACGRNYEAEQLIGLCECGKPLRVDYEIQPFDKSLIDLSGMAGMAAVLPISDEFAYRTLGEGGTPMLPGRDCWIKDEGVNPTGSFKARGMAMAVYMAWRHGVKKLAVPSAGNAGGALAAYAALYGLEAHVFMPMDVPMANRLECELYGAKVMLVDGLITDCAKLVMEGKEREGWFDVSTLKEPYRIEGKKTMGYELVAQLGWKYPDVILYPTGGGTGLIGMWKAFDEMEKLGWVSGKRPRMVSVQAAGCAPIVKAWEQRKATSSSGVFPDEEGVGGGDKLPNLPPQPLPHLDKPETRAGQPHTVAAGLRVPRALGDFIILDILQRSGGSAIAVEDSDLIQAARSLSRETGICICPEGGACLVALEMLKLGGQIDPSDTVVLFNTGTGLKYSEAFSNYPASR